VAINWRILAIQAVMQSIAEAETGIKLLPIVLA